MPDPITATAELGSMPTPTQKPTPGRIVIFKLDDATRERIESCGHLGIVPNNGLPTCSAVVVSVYDTNDTIVNLRLLLDGPPSAVEWKPSVAFGDSPGQWSWPGRA